jgi:hypothetical protein
VTRRALVLLALAAAILAAGLNRPSRLVVDNRTNSAATIQVWRYTGDHWDWQTVGTVSPRTWIPVSDVRDSDRFRAAGPWSAPQVHVVRLYPDTSYGGHQDIWLLR